MSVRLFKSLLFKSANIQREIEREQARKWPDSWRLLKLKKLRLAIKDRMERIVRMGLNGNTAMKLQPARVNMPNRRGPHYHL